MVISNQRGAISEILAAWNPIDAPTHIAESEYMDYIGPIISKLPDRILLRKFLEYTVYETMGLNYDKSNPDHKSELVAVAEQMLTTIGERRDS